MRAIDSLLAPFRRKQPLPAAENTGEASNDEDADLRAPETKLSERQQEKLAALGGILGCTPEQAAAQVYKRMLAGAPNKPLRCYLLPDIKVKNCDRISEEIVRLELENGRVFYGQRSNQKEYLLHHLLSKHLPEAIDGDAYKLAIDVQRRYFENGLPWYCRDGGVFIEGGCFTGMKAIRWHDLSPKPLRVIAVEIGKTNFDLLSLNIRENGLEGAVVPVHAGLAERTGEGTQWHSFSTRRFLETTDRWEGHMKHQEQVRLVTLDDLLDEHDVAVADFVNIQVNGAEVQVLQGMNRSFDRIKVMSIAAYYGNDGVRNLDIVRDILTDKKCKILQEIAPGRIIAVTQKFRREIAALPRHPD